MEKQLEEYRARKRRNQKISDIKMGIKQLFFKDKPENDKEEAAAAEALLEECNNGNRLLNKDENVETTSDINDLEDEADCSCCTYINVIRYISYFTLWASLYGLFIHMEFGIVYLLSSTLLIIYLNTRTKPKKKGEISAYSVFNKDCKSIDGTLKAEQFERELLYR